MPISDREYDSRLSFGNKVNPLVVLIAICMIMFVVLAFFKAITYILLPEGGEVTSHFNQNVLSWFALSGKMGIVLLRIWTIFTYSLVHIQIWQLFANMIWLWFFGSVFIDLTGNRKLVPLFIYGTLTGAIFFLLTANLIPSFKVQATAQHFFGAAPAILAIAIATTTISPGYKVLPILNGGISLWIITLIFLVIDLAGIAATNVPVTAAHLGGGMAGFLFIFIMRRGYDASEWMVTVYDWFMNLFNPDKPQQTTKIGKSSLFYKSSVPPYKRTPHLTQQKLDEILDKINQSGGYDNLNREEKELLERASKEDLGNI